MNIPLGTSTDGILINVQIFIPNQQQWSDPIPFLLDTGATGEIFAVLPRELLQSIGFTVEPIELTSSIQADGSQIQETLCTASLRLKTIPGNQSVSLMSVTVSVIETGESLPLLSLAALSLFNCVIQNGELKLLELRQSVNS